MKRILVTGAYGFIGSNLRPLLREQGHEVIVCAADVSKEIPVSGSVDMVIHLAANTSSKFAQENPRRDFEINALGALNALEIARKKGAIFVYPSTQKVVRAKDGGRSPYGLSKYVGEELCHEWHASYGVKTIINRIGNLYGVGDAVAGDKFWVNAMIQKAVSGETIEVWGDGSQSRYMLYITDLLDLLVKQANEPEKYLGFWQVNGKEELSINQLLKWLNYDKVVYKDSLIGDKATLSYFPQEIPDWWPRVSLEEGLNLCLKHYEQVHDSNTNVQSIR